MRTILKEKLLWVSLLCASSLFANEAHHGINWWHLGSDYKDAPAIGWLTITFLLFVYGIVKAINKPLSLYLETRSKDIKRAIEEGQIAKAEAGQQLANYEQKLSSLSQEIEIMKAQFQLQAEAEKKEKMRLAKDIEQRIMRDTEDSIRAHYTRTKNKLAGEVIELALLNAQKHILEHQRDDMNDLLKKQMLNDLSTYSRDVH